MGLGLVAPEPDGPTEKPFRWLSCRDSFESDVGRVDVCSEEEVGLEASALGDIDSERALPCVSAGGDVCGVMALWSTCSLWPVAASILASLVRESRGVSGGECIEDCDIDGECIEGRRECRGVVGALSSRECTY